MVIGTRPRWAGRKHLVRRRLCIFSALVAVWPSMAYAKITIRQAQYTGGMLLVRGETARAGQTVTLAGRYKTRTDRNGRFRFRVRYLPRIAFSMSGPVRSLTWSALRTASPDEAKPPP